MGNKIIYDESYMDLDCEDKYENLYKFLLEKKSLYDYDNLSFEEFYHFSPFRHNLLSWYTFKKESNILEIGGECGALTSFLTTVSPNVTTIVKNKFEAKIIDKRIVNSTDLNIIVGEYTEILEKLEKKFDYIIISNIELIEKIKVVLKTSMKLLNYNGKILLAFNNTFGLQNLAGSKIPGYEYPFEQFENDKFSYSKTELDNLMSQMYIDNYKYFYPYPNYFFPFEIFSDKYLPKSGTLFNNVNTLEDERLITFDETKAYNKLIESGQFINFVNSYLVVINDVNNPACYVKYSNQRKKEFSIVTTINEINGEKFVLKKALNIEAIDHLNKMVSYYNCFNSLNNSISLCPIKVIDNKTVRFEFIKGETFSKIISTYIKNKDYGNLINEIYELKKGLLENGKVQCFHMTDEFNHVFNVNLENMDLTACSHSNIDLIFDNILISDEKKIVIDYEWTFDFPIPNEYILYRSLFYNSDFVLLDSKIKKQIYNLIGIKEEYLDIFRKMEDNFQKFVSSEENKFNYYLSKINPFNYHMKWFNPKMVHFNALIEIDEKKLKEHCINSMVNFNYNNLNAKKIRLVPVDSNCIIKIHSFVINEKTNVNFKHNADLVINNDYYFKNIPNIEIEGDKEINSIYIKYEMIKRNDTLINQIIDLLIENSNLRIKNDNLINYRKKFNILKKIFK